MGAEAEVLQQGPEEHRSLRSLIPVQRRYWPYGHLDNVAWRAATLAPRTQSGLLRLEREWAIGPRVQTIRVTITAGWEVEGLEDVRQSSRPMGYRAQAVGFGRNGLNGCRRNTWSI